MFSGLKTFFLKAGDDADVSFRYVEALVVLPLEVNDIPMGDAPAVFVGEYALEIPPI